MFPEKKSQSKNNEIKYAYKFKSYIQVNDLTSTDIEIFRTLN